MDSPPKESWGRAHSHIHFRNLTWLQPCEIWANNQVRPAAAHNHVRSAETCSGDVPAVLGVSEPLAGSLNKARCAVPPEGIHHVLPEHTECWELASAPTLRVSPCTKLWESVPAQPATLGVSIPKIDAHHKTCSPVPPTRGILLSHLPHPIV